MEVVVTIDEPHSLILNRRVLHSQEAPVTSDD